MALSDITTNLKSLLSTTLGITSWDAIQFSLLPADSPIGYIQLTSVPVVANQSVFDLQYLVMIGLAANSLAALQSAAEVLVATAVSSFSRPQCLPSGGSVVIASQVVIDTPDSDVTQNNITATSLFRTALAFTMSVQASRDSLGSP